MSSTLLKVASETRSVVAVVGKGHLQGIKKNWKQPVMVCEHSVISVYNHYNCSII
jgi:pheromone shutdown protein TraB